jgi:hypothetical protein
MTPDPIPAIRQRATYDYPLPTDVDTLLALWDTHQTALRALVDDWTNQIEVLRERVIAAMREGAYTEESRLRAELATCREKLAQVSALLPPKEGQ